MPLNVENQEPMNQLRSELMVEINDLRAEIVSTKSLMVALHSTLTIQAPLFKQLSDSVKEILVWKDSLQGVDSKPNTYKGIVSQIVEKRGFWICLGLSILMFSKETWVWIFDKVVKLV